MPKYRIEYFDSTAKYMARTPSSVKFLKNKWSYHLFLFFWCIWLYLLCKVKKEIHPVLMIKSYTGECYSAVRTVDVKYRKSLYHRLYY